MKIFPEIKSIDKITLAELYRIQATDGIVSRHAKYNCHAQQKSVTLLENATTSQMFHWFHKFIMYIQALILNTDATPTIKMKN